MKLPYHNFVILQTLALANQIYITETFFPVVPLPSTFMNNFHMLPQIPACLKFFTTNFTSSFMKSFQVFLKFPSPHGPLLTVITTGSASMTYRNMPLQFILVMKLLPALITPEFLKKVKQKV